MAPSVNKRNTEVKKGVWAERVVRFKPIIFHSWRGLWVWEREREREAERSYINPEQLHVSLTLPFSLRFKSSSFFSLSSNLFLFLFLFPFVTNLAREERGEFVVRIFFFFFFEKSNRFKVCFCEVKGKYGKECWNSRHGYLLPSYLYSAGDSLSLYFYNFCVWMLRKCRWFSDPQVW